MKRLIPQVHVSLLLTLILAALCLGHAPVFDDPDTAWHLAAGDLIRSLHAVPLHDTWSFTAGDARWYNLSWLFDTGFSALFAVGGFPALYVLTILVFALSLTTMAHCCVARGANHITVFALTLLALPVMYAAVHARPNMCSVVLAIVFYQLLHRFRASGRCRDLWPLPPLTALWANLHGGFLLGFILIGIFLAEAWSEGNASRRLRYLQLTVVCFAATLITPYGINIYYAACKSIASGFDNRYINEWKPVEVVHNLPMTVWLILMVWLGDRSDARIPLCDRLAAVLFLLMSLMSVRYSTPGVLFLMPYVSMSLTHALERRESSHSVIRVGPAVMALACLPVAALLLLHGVRQENGFPPAHFPVQEAAFIEEHYPHSRFLNEYALGGYLDFLWRGRVKVFIDGRESGLFSSALPRYYNAFMDSRGYGMRAELVLQPYNIDGLILLNDSAYLSDFLTNPAWRKVYRANAATVFLRN